ncbi:gliding motility protein GldC [Flammeovirga yaeyamensis]|uniref:Gliding motility protein GldC n=1 Tax=Flammeovirga yaeyamensis TaxID=367791 RepID=A0AAX1NBP8_9BACT|nr:MULTISPECIES: gliding motility protein GldC [Flammeovirga]ANQ49025.1 gliding motility protein GldC [Flammeovirga sp. MY04]MBB3699106.1 gliding motility-associated protein GldC [Flammeovirga yaeyamensis]NMF36540.1 gliding motility protein GldC [Flammeovirga yaeyamensis]QWG03502.1 gliding motility protein GldC [Flammeovirga yaeyamensis]
MKESQIRLKVELDDQNVPEKIFWKADDSGEVGLNETRAFDLNIWDHEKKETLRIGLWGKEMTIEELKFFYIDAMGGMAQNIVNATGDQKMAAEIHQLCKKLSDHVVELRNKEGK